MMEALPDVAFDFPPSEALASDAEFWQLYDSAFPANEREPREVIQESVQRGVGVIVRARQNGHTVGLATGHLLREPPVVFVVYLAVVPELRSHRLGSTLFEKLWTEAAASYAARGDSAAGMVWEVDIPERARSAQEVEKSRRRIGFFTRLGGHLLPDTYFQPPVDGVTSVPMHLMYRPAPDDRSPGRTASSALVHAMYFEKYHQANGIPKEVLNELLHKSGR